MKPVTPHDPLDELIAAALHGDLSPQERAQFESRLASDPAAHAAYQEAQAMHDLLEKTNKSAQPDAAFEQRMVSGVRRKIQNEPHRETAWESVLALWSFLRRLFNFRWIYIYGGACSLVVVCTLSVLISMGNQVKGVFTTITSQLAIAGSYGGDSRNGFVQMAGRKSGEFVRTYRSDSRSNVTATPPDLTLQKRQKFFTQYPSVADEARRETVELKWNELPTSTTPPVSTTTSSQVPPAGAAMPDVASAPPVPSAPVAAPTQFANADSAPSNNFNINGVKIARAEGEKAKAPSIPTATPPTDDRKLIRNAQLDLEVKSYQNAMDQITSLTKSAGGYVDTSNSQRGGNGKLEGTVVVKILPQNLDDFLLKLRDLGEVKNQSVSTDDVTKDYFDTQARLANSQKMEVQLQDLLKRENGKVSDLLAVERELGRVRGEIEQMQGQLKLYDFQVQYATVTMQMAEKDLKQTAAYLLKEQDNFSLFATDVETTFQTARKTAEDFKAQVLVANLNHNSGSDVSAELQVSVPPDQIEPFLAQIRGLGRVANFTRNTNRIAQDGGDSAQPADQTLTEKDKVMVNVAIRSDDETRKQVAMTVVTKTVDDALDQAKTAVMAQNGAAILSSSLNKAPEGQSTAQLSVRVPGKSYSALMEAFRALGRTASLSVQRNDDAGPGANGDDAPVIVSLSLTDDDAPLQTTELSVIGSDVDSQSQQIKKDAAAAGVEVKASSFVQQPDGTATAQMTFRMPMSKYSSFLESVQKLGKVESLSVQRNDRPDEARTDEGAPAEINLQLHNVRGIVAENDGLGATLRRTFGEGIAALFGSVRVIGVLIAFTLPWLVTVGVIAWIARRIYIWRKK